MNITQAMEDAQPTPELYQCDRCGRTSTLDAVFIRKKRRNGSLASSVCFDCEGKRQVNSILVINIFLLIFACLNYNLTPDFGIVNFYLLIVSGLLACIPLLVLHELAHAVTARLLGFRVFAIHLGMGKIILTTRFLGVIWVIHPAPISAVTVIAGPDMPYYRLRIFLITLAGPALHAILVVLLLLAHNFWSLSGQWYLVLLWTNIFILIVNIIPRKALVAVGATGTDGLALLQIPRMSHEELQKRFASFYLLEVVTEVEKGNNQGALKIAEQGAALYPDEPNSWNALGYASIYTNDHFQSRDYFLKALSLTEGLTPANEVILLNNVAFANLILDDPALLTEADSYSERAYRALSWEPPIMGTRGGILIALDRPEEGLKLLKQALEKNTDKRGKAIDACLIAWGETKLDHPTKAGKYLAQARQLDPQCPLLDFTTRKMELTP